MSDLVPVEVRKALHFTTQITVTREFVKKNRRVAQM
jgi:hypothetical protein